RPETGRTEILLVHLARALGSWLPVTHFFVRSHFRIILVTIAQFLKWHCVRGAAPKSPSYGRSFLPCRCSARWHSGQVAKTFSRQSNPHRPRLTTCARSNDVH